MTLKRFNPVTPGTRGLVLVDRKGLSKVRPERSLTRGKINISGRNNSGKITVRARGAGHKRLYREITFDRRPMEGLSAKVESIEYDPNRTGFIALLSCSDDAKRYILAPDKLKVGDVVHTGRDSDIQPGNAMPLKNIPVGTVIHNVEIKSKKGAQIARSAGSYANLIGKDVGFVLIRLRSGETRMVSSECYATIGVVSNSDHQNINLGKAGRARWMGRRPQSRGTAMNPVDHGNGGGNGKTSRAGGSVSPWGQNAKGLKTRKKNKFSEKFIVRRV